MNLIIGSKGRFATAIKGEMPLGGAISLPFLDLWSHHLISEGSILSNDYRYCFWASGPGTSESRMQNLEKEGLEMLFAQSKRTRIQVDHFVYLSSGGKMYGVNPGVVNESSAIEPVSKYGKMKRECEIYLIENYTKIAKSLTILRIANSFSFKGFTEKPQGIIETFVNAIIQDTPINILGDLQNQRQYSTHEAYANIVVNHVLPKIDESSSYQIFNLAPNVSLTIEEIIESIEEVFEKKFTIRQTDSLIDSVILTSKFLDFTEFPWKPLTSILRDFKSV